MNFLKFLGLSILVIAGLSLGVYLFIIYIPSLILFHFGFIATLIYGALLFITLGAGAIYHFLFDK